MEIQRVLNEEEAKELSLVSLGGSKVLFIHPPTNMVFKYYNEYLVYVYQGTLNLEELDCGVDGSNAPPFEGDGNEDDDCEEPNICGNLVTPDGVSLKHRIKYYPLIYDNKEFADYGELVLDILKGDIYIRKQEGCEPTSFISATQQIREEIGYDLYTLRKLIKLLKPLLDYKNSNGDSVTFEEYVLSLVEGKDVVFEWKDNEKVAEQPIVTSLDKTELVIEAVPSDAKILFNDIIYDSPLHLNNLSSSTKYKFNSIYPQDNINIIKASISEPLIVETLTHWLPSKVQATTPTLVNSQDPVTHDSIYVEANPPGAKILFNDMVYPSPYKFIDLEPNTMYKFNSYIPRDYDEGRKEHKSPKALEVKTNILWKERPKSHRPKPPIISGLTHNTAEIVAPEDGTWIRWKGDNKGKYIKLENLKPNTEYSVVTVRPRDMDNFLNEIESEPVVFTTKMDWSDINVDFKPEILDLTDTYIKVKVTPIEANLLVENIKSGKPVIYESNNQGIVEIDTLTPGDNYRLRAILNTDNKGKEVTNPLYGKSISVQAKLSKPYIMPKAPTLVAKGYSEIHVKANPSHAFIEFNGKIYETNEKIFTGLNSNTPYKFRSYVPVSDRFMDYISDDSLIVTTDIYWSEPDTLASKPVVESIKSHSAVVIAQPKNAKVIFGGKELPSPALITDLEPNTEYAVQSYIPKDEINFIKDSLSEIETFVTDWSEHRPEAGAPRVVKLNNDTNGMMVIPFPQHALLIKDEDYDNPHIGPLRFDSLKSGTVMRFRSYIPADNVNFVKESISDFITIKI